MPQNVTLKCKGLFTFPNTLSDVPDGALVEANNIVIDRDSVAEPRRGFKLYGSAIGILPDNRARQLLVYKNRILRYWGTTLEFDSDAAGTFVAFKDTTGATAVINEISAGPRIKGIEANGNLYFTSDSGIKKISSFDASGFSSAPVTAAGGVKALDLDASVNPQSGFLSQESAVGYRLVWGIKDANKNLILGSPSQRAVLYNPLLPLLIKDFNSLLNDLDAAAGVGGETLSDTDYCTTLKLDFGSTALSAYEQMLALCNKLDSDLGGLTYAGKTGTITAITASNPAQITSTAHGLTTGTTLTISDSDSVPSVDSTYTITVIDADTFSIPITTTVAGTKGTWRTSSIAAPYSVAPSNDPTTGELTQLQAFYDAIVTQLQAEPSVNIDPSVQPVGSFSTQSATADVTFTIPKEITTAHFYQLYRSPLTLGVAQTVLADISPSDELQLALEGNPSAADISAGVITIHDITPDSFLGANLYTNESSGEGILQANEPPPRAITLATFKNSTFYANTSTTHQLQIALLGIGNLINNVSTLTIQNGATSNTYTFVTPTQEVTSVVCLAGSLTLAGTYFTINAASDARKYYVWYMVDGTGADPAVAGKIGIRVKIKSTDTDVQVADATHCALSGVSDFNPAISGATVTVTNTDAGVATDAADVSTRFTITVITQGTGEDAAAKKVIISQLATPAQQVDETARSLVRMINRQANELVYAYYISSSSTVPGQMLLYSRTLSNTPFFLTVNSDSTGSEFNPKIPTSGQTAISDNNVSPNRIFFSKYQQHESVPLVNYLDVGPKDKAIQAVVALRDSLFVFTDGAIWRLSGTSPSNFSVSLFDSSTLIVSPDTASVLNNQIYLFSTQGIASVSDTGVSIISRPIENQLLPLQGSRFPTFKNQSFALSYETDRSYMLWTVTNPSDTVPTQCFRYNTFTQTWTKWPISKTCGAVNSTGDDKLYLGAGDTNFVEIERKEFTRLDYADREYPITLIAGTFDGKTISLGNLLGVAPGDAITQTQYLTCSQFNRLLKQLDRDSGTAFKNYYDSFQVTGGSNLSDALVLLVAQLNLDTGIADPTFVAPPTTSFATMQAQFNAITLKLNNEPTLITKNYISSNGTTTYEMDVASTDSFKFTITLSFATPFIIGDVIVFKHINSNIVWAPHAMGDPSLLKHIHESTVLFEFKAFTLASAGYSSDLNPSFVPIPCVGEGKGTWGGFPFGQATWGGEGTNAPFRTWVPREKQRCRYINAKFSHGASFEKYAVFGVSFTFEPVSTRAYT